jgi:hypothetical protein
MTTRALMRPEVKDLNAVVEHANREYAKEDKKKKNKR